MTASPFPGPRDRRLLSTLLFGTSPTDVLTYAAVATLLVAIAIGASVVPALRASRVDPLIALRDEGVVSDEVLHRLEGELDVEAIRIGLGEISLDD